MNIIEERARQRLVEALNDPDMLDQPIALWTPKVGDRVRVTAAASECNVHSVRQDGTVFDGHLTVEVGRLGTVDPGPPLPLVDTHIVLVRWDVPIEDGRGGGWSGGFYAVHELEPVERA